MRGLAESFQATLLTWFDRARRDLPWRRPLDRPDAPLDPYAVLVSEAMLQQTQVATVIPYFNRWMQRFPTVEALAAADENEVLTYWQGLGYYRRARNLYNAARMLVERHQGQFPRDLTALRALPGVGPYTAGAIASIAFDEPVPLVDGNVQRVLLRLDAQLLDPRSKDGQRWLWERAGQLVPANRPGDFNSALMELGATVCSPRKPRCLNCPVAMFCEAHHAGTAERIPPPRPTRTLPHVRRTVWCVRRADGRWLLERRPTTGRWAGLWQFPSRDFANKSILNRCGARPLQPLGHTLTHRRYHFEPWAMELADGTPLPVQPLEPHAWVTLDELGRYALPKPHLLIAEQLRALQDNRGDIDAPPAGPVSRRPSAVSGRRSGGRGA
ncbi:MAG: A/G-specific adenine glycosylase [Tepidisphaerales bacterium]